MLQASDEFWADEHETFVDVNAQNTKKSAQLSLQQIKDEIAYLAGSIEQAIQRKSSVDINFVIFKLRQLSSAQITVNQKRS